MALIRRMSTGDGLERAERPDLAVLQHAQQPRLQRQRHVADLVEEQRAAAGLHDQPLRSLASRAGEGAGLVAEQLGIDQALRHRRAVQRDIIVARAVARRVDGAREHVLAGAGLATQQDRQIEMADASSAASRP